MKQTLFLTAAMGAAALAEPLSAARKPAPQPHQGERPNIVLFLVDDMGWQDTSEPFWHDTTALNRTYHTPNMERLAKQAMKFTSCYVSPVSSPSRVSLMTGMSPAAHRVTNWTLYKDKGTDMQNPALDFPKWNVNGIAPELEKGEPRDPMTTYVTALPEVLRRNGYRTIIVGKGHFGAIGTPGAEPKNLGFDVNVAAHAGGGLASYLGEQNFGNVPGVDTKGQKPFAVPDLEQYWGKDIFATEALTLEAKKQIDTALVADKPFFLYMSHYAVHVPLDKDPRFYQKYRDRGLDEKEAAYAALIEGMDKSLGDLMDYLKEKKIDRNTVIIFLSDNGGLSALGRGGRPNTHNFPLRSGKGSPMEGGVRVPMMVAYPGVIDGGLSCATPVTVQDLMPTMLGIAHVKKNNTVQKIEGSTIRYLWEGRPHLRRNYPIVMHFPNKWDANGDGIGTFSSIRMGDWKLIYYYATGQSMLFNIAEDIFEKIDHSANPTQAERKKKMLKRLTRELRRVDAQVPIVKATGEWCRYPDGSEYHQPRRERVEQTKTSQTE